MTRKNLIVISLALCLTAAAPAWARSHPQPETGVSAQSSETGSAPDKQGAPAFDEVDKNGDGKLTRSEIPKDVEALKALRAHFREADLDGNGSLSQQEYAAYIASVTQKVL